jgi:hypothetical protein
MVWSVRDDREFAIFREIESASDRVTAIVAAAFIEERLRDAISARLLRDPKGLKNLFDPDGALGNYETRVKMGYMLGIYVKETRDNLEAIGKIRNRFAHRTHITDFNHKELEPFFKQITLPDRLLKENAEHPDTGARALRPGASKRARFLTTIQMLLSYFLPHEYREHLPAYFGPRF